MAGRMGYGVSPFAAGVNQFATGINPFATGINQLATGVNPFAAGVTPFNKVAAPFNKGLAPWGVGAAPAAGAAPMAGCTKMMGPVANVCNGVATAVVPTRMVTPILNTVAPSVDYGQPVITGAPVSAPTAAAPYAMGVGPAVDIAAGPGWAVLQSDALRGIQTTGWGLNPWGV